MLVTTICNYIEHAGASRPTPEEVTPASIQRYLQHIAAVGLDGPQYLCPACRTAISTRPVAAPMITELVQDLANMGAQSSEDSATAEVGSAERVISELGLAAFFVKQYSNTEE